MARSQGARLASHKRSFVRQEPLSRREAAVTAEPTARIRCAAARRPPDVRSPRQDLGGDPNEPHWKLEFHYTPVHGRWFNMAELELSLLARQRLHWLYLHPA